MTDGLIEAVKARAAILHASAAWGSDGDGMLLNQLVDYIEKTVPRDVAELWKAKAENLSAALKEEQSRHDDLLSKIMAHAVQAMLDPRFAKDQAWEIEQLIVAEKIKP